MSSRKPKREVSPRLAPPPPLPPTARGVWQRSQRFSVYRGNELLGRTDLQMLLPDGSGAAGQFHPEAAFFRYSDVFFRFRRALQAGGEKLGACVRERDSLDLRLWRAAEQLDAAIEMISPWGRNTWVIHVRSSDPRLMDRDPG